MEVEIRKLTTVGDTFMVSIPKGWAEELGGKGTYLILKRDGDTIIMRPWTSELEE